ncbi:50S ribosomal protein L9 [Leptospirillum ferriphilum]|uniref:Large ribosomal subunit protein bL9 n=2 Tax=Leptospirillum ferriphilum TaxID=178606 RepID=A0A1V3SU56_9BACT|nr:50S ribosomal protein L9 [Leptospirillum ferriphilum]AFS54684.1 ribosomal protein L9 [Leptospirillum ferriphilum ML-04]OOH71602.1 50S ribosomal protein L9 [Leptospirillum ferriphilum]OOH83760.1 50S ribosomal protein L9 [Leptospirillum ferriphilum]
MSKVAVILRENVEKLGSAGDLVQVSRGYARNYLIPLKKGIEADSKNIALVEIQKKHARERAERHQREMGELAGRISSTELNIPVKVGSGQKLFGSVTAHDISDAFGRAGIVLDRKQIHLEAPLREIGTFEIEVRLGLGIKCVTKVNVVSE